MLTGVGEEGDVVTIESEGVVLAVTGDAAPASSYASLHPSDPCVILKVEGDNEPSEALLQVYMMLV